MANAAVDIDEIRKESGASLLQMADDLGMGVLGAGWIYDPRASHWHYFIVTPMLDSKGPAWIYERLTKVFQKRPLPPSITPLDIRILSPNEHLFQTFPYRAGPDNVGLAVVMHIRDNDDRYIYAYRMLPKAPRRPDQAGIFDRKVRQLTAA